VKRIVDIKSVGILISTEKKKVATCEIEDKIEFPI
jgi:hypothetical protein